MEAQPGPSREDFSSHSQWNEPELGLTIIGYQDSASSGNVHTGAVPPWLLEEPDEAWSSGQQDMGPSLQEFLKHNEQEKLKSFRPTEWVQTLTTAHILMPTGCHRLDVCGIVAGAGSQGISSEKRRQKRGGRGKMLGKQQRSKKTSVMESGCPTYIGSMGKVVYALAFSY